MAKYQTAAPFLPERLNLTSLRSAADRCRGCELYANATQTVFSQGTRNARVMLVGEMPDNDEDLVGKPFVGPAGRLLNETLDEAGISRMDAYLTNAVKHFRWERRGKRRLHKKPTTRQIEACRPWLQAEILVVKPPMIVCLGATAAQTLLGRNFRVTQQRGNVLTTDWADGIVATYHPSAILRTRSSAAREDMRQQFVADLRIAWKWLSARRELSGG